MYVPDRPPPSVVDWFEYPPPAGGASPPCSISPEVVVVLPTTGEGSAVGPDFALDAAFGLDVVFALDEVFAMDAVFAFAAFAFAFAFGSAFGADAAAAAASAAPSGAAVMTVPSPEAPDVSVVSGVPEVVCVSPTGSLLLHALAAISTAAPTHAPVFIAASFPCDAVHPACPEGGHAA